MIKLEFHNLRQIADACKNYMEAFLKEKQKSIRSLFFLSPLNQQQAQKVTLLKNKTTKND